MTKQRPLFPQPSTPSGITAGEFLASGHRVLQRFIELGPLRVATRLCLASLPMLVLAWMVRVHSLAGRGNVGFWWQPNWSLMYIIVLPLIFAGFVHLAELMKRSVETLSDPDVRIITSRSTVPVVRHIAERLRHTSRRVRWTCLSLAVALTLLDMEEVIRIYARHFAGQPALQSIERDWSNAFLWSAAVDPQRNLAFVLLAYLFEAAAIGLGFFFIAKFWLFLKALSHAIMSADAFEFHPKENDPDHRLGLRPLGGLVNIYLGLVIVFQIYILLHRLQQIGHYGPWRIDEYLNRLASGAKSVSTLFQRELYAWHAVDTGMWLLLILMTLPLIVVCYFPLWTLRRYVQRRRDELWQQHITAFNEATERGDEEAVIKHKQQLDKLKGTQVWPNGDATARRLLMIMAGIALAAWLPPVFIWLAAAGFAGETLKGIYDAVTRKTASA